MQAGKYNVPKIATNAKRGTSRESGKPIGKLLKMNVNIVLTKNYEGQQKSDKKTNPICWTKSLILSEKSMIPN